MAEQRVVYSTRVQKITFRRFVEIHRFMIADHGDRWFKPEKKHLSLLIDQLNRNAIPYFIHTGYPTKEGSWVPQDMRIFIKER